MQLLPVTVLRPHPHSKGQKPCPLHLEDCKSLEHLPFFCTSSVIWRIPPPFSHPTSSASVRNRGYLPCGGAAAAAEWPLVEDRKRKRYKEDLEEHLSHWGVMLNV